MMRSISGVTVLLVLAIFFVVVLLLVRNQQPPIDDPVGDAVKELSQGLGMDVDRDAQGGAGVAVLAVKAGSPADRLGLRKGDLIRAVGDRTIWHAKALHDQLSESLQRGGASLLVENNGVFRQILMGGVAAGRMAGAGTGAGTGPAGRAGMAGRAPGGARAPGGRGAARGQTSQPWGDGGPAGGR